LRRRIADSTVFEAAFPYFAIATSANPRCKLCAQARRRLTLGEAVTSFDMGRIFAAPDHMKRLCVLALVLAGFATEACATFGLRPSIPSASRSGRVMIARAQVWIPTDIPSMNLALGPQGPGAFAPGATVSCVHLDKRLSGTTPKFACQLADGDEVKVKYGGNNGEVFAEVASSRLLWALGFGADRMYSVRIICRGCPDDIGSSLPDGQRVVEPAAVERKSHGKVLFESWAWDELDLINESAGGAARAQRDALRLLAVLLQHSDSKPEQQRAVCFDGATRDDGLCARPLMMIQDLGVTFGRANPFNQQLRASMNLAEWAKTTVWKHPDKCVGRLSGSLTGTLKDPLISEEGRAFLAGLLSQLSDQQLHDMFEAARVTLRPRVPRSVESGYPMVDEWVTAFKQKRQEIVDRRCA
jgi:hypothetical protein